MADGSDDLKQLKEGESQPLGQKAGRLLGLWQALLGNEELILVKGEEQLGSLTNLLSPTLSAMPTSGLLGDDNKSLNVFCGVS